jgi:hypothetical protein
MEEQIAHYDPMHAGGLLAEHRFLQVVAAVMGYTFSLRELVELNPHGDPPEDGWKGDWDVLRNQLPSLLNEADQVFDRAHAPAVREFYQRLAFERVRHDA